MMEYDEACYRLCVEFLYLIRGIKICARAPQIFPQADSKGCRMRLVCISVFNDVVLTRSVLPILVKLTLSVLPTLVKFSCVPAALSA